MNVLQVFSTIDFLV